MFLLVRTEPDAPRHRGLSYLLLDMKSEGLTVRPLKQMHGLSDFNEVFFDGVRTPADWIVGNRGEGWSVAGATLKFERTVINPPDVVARQFDALRELARNTIRYGRPLLEDSHFQQAFAKLEGFVLSHTYSVMRQNSMEAAGQSPGLASLLNKLCGAQVGLQIAALAPEVIGSGGFLMPANGVTLESVDWPFAIMRSLATTIAGGASNIQRNIVAERGLGLPRAAGGGK